MPFDRSGDENQCSQPKCLIHSNPTNRTILTLSCLHPQIAQGLLANHRKDDLAHHAVRLGQCGIGQFEQQVLLAADALDVIEQFTFDLAFGAGTDAVDRLDQQVDQIVGEAARAQIDKRGKPGDSRRIGMPAKFMRSLDCHSPPASAAA
jgi:hypothetical protein